MELAVDLAEAQAIARTELEDARRLGYERLRSDAPPRHLGPERPPRFLRRWMARIGEPPESRRHRWLHGESGVLYQVVREITWDSGYGGTIRIWVTVDDIDSVSEPVVGCELVDPPGSVADPVA